MELSNHYIHAQEEVTLVGDIHGARSCHVATLWDAESQLGSTCIFFFLIKWLYFLWKDKTTGSLRKKQPSCSIFASLNLAQYTVGTQEMSAKLRCLLSLLGKKTKGEMNKAPSQR
jgi:hypothetical protein